MNATEKKNVLHGVGRRKTSVARVWLKKGGTGAMVINEKDYSNYFDSEMTRKIVEQPFKVASAETPVTFDVYANIDGGGMMGQAQALSLGIARALLMWDEALKAALRKHGLLTVDSRIKERKKYGQRGARRKFQFVKR